MTLQPGTRLGRYEIRSLLGSGGMGAVYLAYDRDLERDVAVKVLHGTQAGGDRERRFIQEAKAASGLHHPNVAHVYEIGSQDDIRFIAMEIVEGDTLRDRMTRGPLTIEESVDIATQIAAALAAAHNHGVVHRDVKPENVIVSADGHAKVLDFGLAKLRELRADNAETILKTTPGTAMGTIPYMAPEQIGGEDITPAADVFSFGVVLYEMLAGRRPFAGASSSEIASAILTKSPQSIRHVRTDVPAALDAIVAKCLAKQSAQRYATAAEVHVALRALKPAAEAKPRDNRKAILIIAAVVILLSIIASAFVVAQRKRRDRIATQNLATAERLVGERKLAEAYALVAAVAGDLPNDDRVRDLLNRTSTRATVESDPPGAVVYAQRFRSPETRTRLGVTPLTVPHMPRADYLFTFEKPGYATSTRSVSLTPRYLLREAFFETPSPIRMKLVDTARAPEDMVLVTGGEYRLNGFYRPSERAVALRDFFIDRYEVSNRQFERFVRDGGYRRRELWKYPFVDAGKTLSFEQAMARFQDATGLPGPRGWTGGAPPAGRENHPVADVTWYEAAAFAEWKGGRLPTIYQWEKAARYPAASSTLNAYPWGVLGDGIDATERANFLGAGTMPVDSMPFGASAFGAQHMAGNVSEWCRNVDPPGYAARGGSYKDAIYAFGQTAALPGFFSAPTLGFRCARGGGGDEGDFALDPNGFVPKYVPVDDRTFEQFRQRYDYPRAPLDAKVTARAETTDWTRETVTFNVAGKTVTAYLYLPKGFKRPLQAIFYAPAGDVVNGQRTLLHSIDSVVAPYIRGGRALFSVELEGYLGRPHPAGWVAPDPTQDEYVDLNVERVTEMRRGLDYLETRPEIDRSRIAMFGISAGAGTGIFVSALETRFRTVVFAGSGVSLRQASFAPAANRVHFAARIKGPTLFLQGRYDEDTSLKSEAEPMFRLVPEPKRMEIYEGTHVAPPQIAIPVITKWLDQTMGPVQQ